MVETNVVEVARALAGYAKTEHNQDKFEQRVYYDTGIGAAGNKFHQYLAGAFGFGLRDKVKHTYEAIVKECQMGGKHFLFDFARGP